MKSIKINNMVVYSPDSSDNLIDYVINKKKILIAINAEKILNANEKLKKIVNNNIGYPDGFGAVLALRKKGLTQSKKIPGCELWLEFVNKFYMTKSFYIIGSTNTVIKKTIIKLKKQFKGINILNYRDGYIKSNKEKDILCNDISFLKPDIVLVAMGTPFQEYFMYELHSRHKAIYIGLGGSFDIYAGNLNRAPSFFIKKNLEWLYRLYKQPKRIIRQIKYASRANSK